jgi:SH3-like domain-containing protein
MTRYPLIPHAAPLLFFLCWGIAPVGINAQPSETAGFPYQGEIISDKVNIRAGQNENFETLGRLKKGEKVVVTDRSYSWLKIRLPSQAGSYVHSQFVMILEDGIGQVRGNRVNVRARPKLEASILGQIHKGDLVKVLEESPAAGWLKVEPVNGLYGWISANFVTFYSQDVPAPRIVQPPVRNVYQKRRMAIQKAGRARQDSHAAAAKAPEPLAVGVINALGSSSLSAEIRHRLDADGRVYFLKGYRSMLDGFVRQKVKIQGEIQPDIPSAAPVVLVTRIELVL